MIFSFISKIKIVKKKYSINVRSHWKEQITINVLQHLEKEFYRRMRIEKYQWNHKIRSDLILLLFNMSKIICQNEMKLNIYLKRVSFNILFETSGR
jgi:hypothetical protein